MRGGYQATYRQGEQVLIAKRVLKAQRPSMVCHPRDHQIARRLRPVVQRGIRGHIFYE